MAYENKSNWTLGENKPNSNPIKPNFFKSISALKEWQENKAVIIAHRRHEYQSQILRTRFIRRFFGLTVRFFTHLGVEFGFDYLFGQGCTKIKEERLIALPLFLKEEECCLTLRSGNRFVRHKLRYVAAKW
jgi:hypothetical protein